MAAPRVAPPAALPHAKADCSHCDAVCCRLTVVLLPEDDVPADLTTRNAAGLHVMDHDAEGWCVAVNRDHLGCSIYAQRPSACRRFSRGGPYCREVRREYHEHQRKGIPLTLHR